MEENSLKRHAGLIGLGLMYLWGTGIVVWADWIKSDVLTVKIIGYVGIAITSVSGISTFFYVNELETRMNKLERQCVATEEEALYWRNKAERHSLNIDK